MAHDSFSEGGTIPVSSLKAAMTMLAMHGGSLGETWDKMEKPNGRPNDNLDWMLDLVHNELDLPLIIKGIIHPADAVRAVEKGVDAIWVTNHGGRQARP